MLCALWVKVRRKLGAKDVKRCVRVCVYVQAVIWEVRGISMCFLRGR